jgi:hypothetical protein
MSISLLPALVVVLAVGYVAGRHQRVFLTLFMLSVALDGTRDFAPSLAMAYSGFNFYPNDVVTLVGAFAALNHLREWRLRGATRLAALVLIVLVGLGVITWTASSDLQHGANGWRLLMLSVALLMYATTRPRTWTWRDLQVIIVMPAIVVALASVAGILLYGFGSSSSSVEIAGGVMYDSRPVSAPASLIMLTGLWITTFAAGKWTGGRTLTVALLGSMVLLTQNRSVWVAAILGAGIWWLGPRIRDRGASRGLGGASRTIVAFIVAAATAVVGVSVAALGQSASNDHTLLWRIALWAESMNIPRSPLEWLLGSTLGPTPAAAPGLFPAHSLYVLAIEMTGFIGLGAMIYLLVATRKAQVPPWTSPLGLAVCVSLLSFCVFYPLPPWAWMLTGILLVSNQADFAGEERRLLHGTALEEVHV